MGPSCDMSVDDCADSPCQNGGACVDAHRGYSCRCLPGFTGIVKKRRKDSANFIICYSKDMYPFSASNSDIRHSLGLLHVLGLLTINVNSTSCTTVGWLDYNGTLDFSPNVPATQTYTRTQLYIILTQHVKSQPCLQVS